MKLLKHFPIDVYSSSCWGYEKNGREYVIFGWYYGTSIIDITDEDNIHTVAFIQGKDNGWREIKVHNDYLYVVSEADSSGIQIIDLSKLPVSADLVNTYFFEGYKRAHTISQSGNYLYVNGGNYLNGGIVILDIGKDPVNPVKLGDWQDDYVHDCRIINDTIWACNPLSGRVSVINAVDKNRPVTITSWVNGLYPVPHNCAMTGDGKYLYVCDENFAYPGKLKIWNISDKRDITYSGSWNVEGTSHSVHNVEIFGNYAFLAYYGEGIRVLDISQPEEPVEIAWYKTSGCWQGYYFTSGKIAASDIYDGLYILKTEDPISVRNTEFVASAFSLSQNYPNPFNPVTNIKFQIPEEGFIKLSVFNVLGREIQTIVNQQLSPGSYSVDFNGSNLPSGVYYYRFETNSVTETRKMVLIK